MIVYILFTDQTCETSDTYKKRRLDISEEILDNTVIDNG